MPLHALPAFGAAAIMLAFGVVVLRRFLRRRKAHYLFWGTGLLMFGLASLSEVYLSLAWSTAVFTLWYLFGAILTAAWIGQGTLHLLFRRPWVRVVAAVLILASLGAALVMLRAVPDFEVANFTSGVPISEQYREILPRHVRLLTPAFNIYGTIAIVGGALWSSFLFWRKRVMPNRVIGNVLIAVGALVIASASTLTRAGYGQLLFVGELLAAILMFAGFHIAGRPPQAERRPAEE